MRLLSGQKQAMGTTDPLLFDIRQALQAATRIRLLSHVRPDGDAVGSLLGLGLALQNVGKDVQMILADGVPASLRHLPGSDQVRSGSQGDFDLTVTVDCSEPDRLGEALPPGAAVDINIDHHVTNTHFARLNLVQPQAVATAEILAASFDALGLTLTPAVAAALLNGIITDTIGFRTSNVSSAALRTAAHLVDCGADLPGLYQRALLTHSFNALHYWGAGLSKLQRADGLVWTTLTLADRKSADYPGRDDADLINLLSAIEGLDVAIVFIEQSERRVKVSWRARPGLDVAQLAVTFGGGGHKAAAGAEIEGNLQEVLEKVLTRTRSVLDRSG